MKRIISLSVVAMLVGVTAFAQDTTLRSNSASKDSMQKNGDSTLSQHSTTYNKDSSTSTSTTMDSTNTMASGQNNSSKMSGSKDSSKSMNSHTQGNSTTVADTATKIIPTDRVIMKEDKMYIVKSGDSTILEKSYKLESGAIVSTTGNVKYPSGRTVQLKNGQFIELKKPVSTDTKKITESKKTTTTKKHVS